MHVENATNANERQNAKTIKPRSYVITITGARHRRVYNDVSLIIIIIIVVVLVLIDRILSRLHLGTTIVCVCVC